MFDLGGPLDRSFRRRGQRLVVVGALLGALIGVVLGLVVQDAGTSRAVAAPGRGSALAASRPGSQPPASRTAGSRSRAAGNDASGSRQAESPDPPDKRHGSARKDSQGGPDNPDNDKLGKGEHGKGERGEENQGKNK